MAVTVTQNGRTNVSGNRLTVSLSLTDDDTSYNAGGIVFDANQYVGNPDMVHIESVFPGYVFSYDRANKKIQAFAQRDDANAPADPDSGTPPLPLTEVVGEDLSAITLRIMITGTRA